MGLVGVRAWLLLAVLGLSLAANGLLWHKLDLYYRAYNALRLSPVDLDRYPQGPAAAQVPPAGVQRLVFYGDSRAAAWRAPPWPGVQVLNRGIDRETSGQALLRFDRHVTPLRPDLVVLQLGVNDLTILPLPPATRDGIIERCKANLRALVEKARRLGSRVVVTTLFPLGEDIPLRWRPLWPKMEDIQAAIREINAELRSLEGDGVMVFDAYRAIERDGRVKPEYVLDFIHLNPAGYDELNRHLARLLEAAPDQGSQ